MMMQDFLEAMTSYYYDGKALLTDEEFEALREVEVFHAWIMR